MLRQPSRIAVAVAAALALFACTAGCTSAVVEVCYSDGECNQVLPGQCLPAPDGKRYCAFPDGKCPSMLRWDQLAPPSIRLMCRATTDDGGVPRD